MELSKLNPDKAYIQVTHAEPYFDNYGKRSFFVFSNFISSTIFDIMIMQKTKIMGIQISQMMKLNQAKGLLMPLTSLLVPKLT